MSNNKPLTEAQQKEIQTNNAIRLVLKKLLDDYASIVAEINRSRMELLEATNKSDPMIIQKHAQVNLLAQKYIAMLYIIKLIDMTSARDVAINVQQLDIAMREYRQQLDLYKRDQRIGAKSAQEIAALEKEWSDLNTFANNFKNILIENSNLLAEETSPTLQHIDTDEAQQLSDTQQLFSNVDALKNINTSNKIFIQLYDLYREIGQRRKNIFLYLDSGDPENKRDENLRELKQLSDQFIQIIKNEMPNSDDEMQKWLITFKLEQILLPKGFINSVEKTSESGEQLHRMLVKRESEQTNLPIYIVEMLLQLPRDNEVLGEMMKNHFATNSTTESASTDETWFSSLINFFQSTEDEEIIQQPTAKKSAVQGISSQKIANLTEQIIAIGREVTAHWKTPTDLNKLVKLKKQIDEITAELSDSSLLEHRITLYLNSFRITDVKNLSAMQRLEVLGGILDHLLFDAYEKAFNEAYKKFDASSLKAAEKVPSQVFNLKQAISDMNHHIKNLPKSLQSIESFGEILGYVPPSSASQNREQKIRDDMVAKLADAKSKIAPLDKKYAEYAAAAKNKQTTIRGQTHSFTRAQWESIGISPADIPVTSTTSAVSRSPSEKERSAGTSVPLQQKKLAESTTGKQSVGNKEISGYLNRLKVIRVDIAKMIKERDAALNALGNNIDLRKLDQLNSNQRTLLSGIQTRLDEVNKEWRNYKSTHTLERESENVSHIDTLFKTIKESDLVRAKGIINSNKTSDQYKPTITTAKPNKSSPPAQPQ